MSPKLETISLKKPISVSQGCVGVLVNVVSDMRQTFTMLMMIFPEYPFEAEIASLLRSKKTQFAELKPGEGENAGTGTIFHSRSD
jgi:hypothetical protein